ncbi:B3 domain-containing protein [Melia azedarach]|uniref:B3 domain-containing protein n=1 Tax=Melia azedarach TaxID=155640 RepID=A0ACC1YTT7_MELAZ|nr:B3 domain-containing protein [Melia azedarach]
MKVKKNCTGLEALRAVTDLAGILLEEERKERESKNINIGDIELREKLCMEANSNNNNKRKRDQSEGEKERVVGSISKQRGRSNNSCSSCRKAISKSKINGTTDHEQSPAPFLPEKLKNYIIKEMGGRDIKFVIQKNLYKSDLTSNHGRLLMPLSQIREKNFLTKEEILKVSAEEKPSMTKEEKKELQESKKIPVKIVEPSLEQSEMKFTRWYVGNNHSCPCYVLIAGWTNFAEKHGLKVDEGIQVWSFRRGEDDQLSFALVRIEESAAAGTGRRSSSNQTASGEERNSQ